MIAAFALLTAIPSAPVTALATYRGDVYVGHKDGAVERSGSNGTILLAKANGTAIGFISASPYGIAWLSGPGGAVRKQDAPGTPADQTLTIEVGGRIVSVRFGPTSQVRRLAWLQDHVAACYDIGEALFDAAGRQVTASSFMPQEAAAVAPQSSLWVREQRDGTELAVFARPYSVRQDPRNQKAPLVSLFTAFQVGSWQWVDLGGFASSAFDAFPDGELKATSEGRIAGDAKFLVLSDRVALAEDGVVARESDSLLSAPVFTREWQTARLAAAGIPGDSLWFGASTDSAWWWNGSALIQQSRHDGSYCAYLPWVSAAGSAPSAFALQGDGLWIGSEQGLLFLDPAKPDPETGFGGFVRVPFGVPAPTDPASRRLADAIFAWRFASADKAGKDGGAMVASVFSAFGLKLPEAAAELKRTGEPVTGEIQFGDVILTDKSAAIYLGNGTTVAVKGNRVENGDIWAYPNAVVRRFVPSS